MNVDVWGRVETLAQHIENKFRLAGLEIEAPSDYGWKNSLFTSYNFRRAHIEIVDNRDSHKLYILHCTVFPHFDDPAPIWGFDAVCGPNKITGAFHDFSMPAYSEHPMAQWWAMTSSQYQWHKPRQLPEWAQAIFSKNMVAAGNVNTEEELDAICNLAEQALDYYLENVGDTRHFRSSFKEHQNIYCRYQKQNPHVVRSMVSMGVPEDKMRKFVDEVLFPESA
jgi:hypothetical protein